MNQTKAMGSQTKAMGSHTKRMGKLESDGDHGELDGDGGNSDEDDEVSPDVDISDTEFEKEPIVDPDDYTPTFRIHVPKSLVGPVTAEEKALDESLHNRDWNWFGED